MTQSALTRRSHVSPLEAGGAFFDTFGQDFMRRFFEPLGFSPSTSGPFHGSVFIPAVDMTESAEQYTLVAELPGLRKDDIEITLDNHALVISGERHFENQSDVQWLSRERALGRFSRSFVLPKAADTAKVEAFFRDGLLTVTVPKAPEAQARRISVH